MWRQAILLVDGSLIRDYSARIGSLDAYKKFYELFLDAKHNLEKAER